MGKRTTAIRKGFEYQDLYCAIEIATLIELGELATEFIIESDEIHHIDDLQIFPQHSEPVGCQVKFHTERSYVDSFDSLMAQPAPNARSLLQKLYRGWLELSSGNTLSCELRYFSSSTPDPEDKGLGSVIRTEDDRISDIFFSDNRYADIREQLGQHLGADDSYLQSFLKSIRWRLPGPPLVAMKQRLVRNLQRLGWPANNESFLVFLDAIGYYAEQVTERTSIAAFVIALSGTPQFREACEQRFPQLDFEHHSHARAVSIRIAAVDIQALHSFKSHGFACDEEPAILRDYKRGLTVPELSGVFDDLRSAWISEHMRWLRRRLTPLLEWLATADLDCILFPRFAIDANSALEIDEWCRDHNCHAVVGGGYAHALPDIVSDMENVFNTKLLDPSPFDPETETAVIDILFRPGRMGRGSLSITQTPYSKREKIASVITTAEILTARGLLTVAALPSISMVTAFNNAKLTAPELLLCCCGPTADALRATLCNTPSFAGIPAILCTPTASEAADVTIVKPDGPDSITQGAWEGITLATVHYDRSAGQHWSARISDVLRIPIVYQDDPRPATLSSDDPWLQKVRGLQRSVGLVKYTAAESLATLNTNVGLIALDEEDPDNFFLRRLYDAREAIRDVIGELDTSQVGCAARSLEEIESRIRDYEAQRILPYDVVPLVQVPPPLQRPSLVNRADESAQISRLADGTGPRRILLLHGTPGVGKTAIVEHVARLTDTSQSWVYITALPNATFAEFVGLLLLQLGETLVKPPPLNDATFEALVNLLRKADCSLLVIRNGENLPLVREQAGHTELLSFLSYVARSASVTNVRMLLLSSRRGRIETFSGRHLFDTYEVVGLPPPETLRLLQELVAATGATASTAELEQLGRRIHGHPGLAEVAVGLLTSVSASELIDSLHERQEVRKYIVNQMLGPNSLRTQERDFVKYAALFRVPVEMTAFAHTTGAHARSIIRALSDRLLITEQNGRIRLHPLIADHFRSQLQGGAARALHRHAFKYFDGLLQKRNLDIEESAERIYHGLRAGENLQLRDYQLFLGPARAAMLKSLRSREWPELEYISQMILELLPDDPVARVAKAVAVEAVGKASGNESCEEALYKLDPNDLWIAVEYVRGKIRKHDYDVAGAILDALESRYGPKQRIVVARAQLLERKGAPDAAVDECIKVLSDTRSHPSDIRTAALVLRRANRLDILIRNLDPRKYAKNDDLHRLYALARVATRDAPLAGLETLERLWAEQPTDGYIIADFAAALGMMDQDARAEELFRQGLSASREFPGYFALLEEYASFLQHKHRYREATRLLRELLNARPYLFHVKRRFARCLFEEAKATKAEGNYEIEEACIREADQILSQLVIEAPADQWAQHCLQIVKNRDYSASLIL